MSKYQMDTIKPPFSSDLMQILNKFIKDIFAEDLSQIKCHDVEYFEEMTRTKLPKDDNEYYTSKEHLRYMQNDKKYEHKEDEGYAEVTNGINLALGGGRVPEKIRKIMMDLDKKLNGYFMSKFTAVNMYYPKGGFMGWHNNANCPGWNVIMSYTPEPHKGYFEFIDPSTQETVRLDDDFNVQDGWTIKVGYYGSHEEINQQVWHCARSYDNERITLAYVIPDEHKRFWDMMVEDLKD